MPLNGLNANLHFDLETENRAGGTQGGRQGAKSGPRSIGQNVLDRS